MTIHLVTFATPDMERSAELCMGSALRHGIDYTSIWRGIQGTRAGDEFYEQNKALMDQPRGGGGYFCWKPFVILETMKQMKDGEYVCYSDAGIEFIDNINYIIDRMDQDIFLFGNMYEHAHWCKRDIVEAIWPDRPTLPITDIVRTEEEMRDYNLRSAWERFGKQVQASVIFFRVNDKTRAFVKEWLDWCLFEGGRLIDDSPSRTPNHPEFRENRHDQAILTTLAYRDRIKLHWWPAVYNDGAFIYPRGDYEDLGYPALFLHHRGVKTGERTA